MIAPERPRVVASFRYIDDRGSAIARIDRVEPGLGGRAKDFLPYLARPDGTFETRAGLHGESLPLYHLDEVLSSIANCDRILFVEGEGKADALCGFLRGVGVTAAVTTIAGGANAPLRADHIESLRGARSVVVLVDSDTPGRACGLRRSELIAKAHPDCDVRLVDLFPDRHDGVDIADWLVEGHTLDELYALVDAAQPVVAPARGAAGDNRRPQFVRASDLIAESDSDELPCVVEGLLLLGGTAILAGRPKGGKSTLATNLALAVARGEPFLGRDARKGPVLYLALEGAQPGWCQLLRRRGTTPEEDLYFHIGRAPEGALQWLRDAIERHHPVLVIVDTMQRLLRVKDGNDYATGSNATDAVIELARECGAALIMLHHSGKTRHADVVDEVMGSTAWAAAVDSVIVLRKTGDRRTLASEQRFGTPLEETVLQMDGETHRISPAGPKRQADLADVREAIVAYLRERSELHPGDPAVDEATIMQNVEGRTALKREGLREAVAANDIGRSGDGKKGKPYLYAFRVPLVPAIGRERENENRNSPQEAQEIEFHSRSGPFKEAGAFGAGEPARAVAIDQVELDL